MRSAEHFRKASDAALTPAEFEAVAIFVSRSDVDVAPEWSGVSCEVLSETSFILASAVYVC